MSEVTLESLKELSNNITDNISILGDMLIELQQAQQILPVPFWEAIRIKVESNIRLYGAAARYLQEIYQEKQANLKVEQVEEEDELQAVAELILSELRSAKRQGKDALTIRIILPESEKITLH